jgi:hypothetical protein
MLATMLSKKPVSEKLSLCYALMKMRRTPKEEEGNG